MIKVIKKKYVDQKIGFIDCNIVLKGKQSFTELVDAKLVVCMAKSPSNEFLYALLALSPVFSNVKYGGIGATLNTVTGMIIYDFCELTSNPPITQIAYFK